MKRLMILLALSAIPLTTPSLAFAAAGGQPGQPGEIQFCKGDVAVNTQFTLGDCVGFVSTAERDVPGFGPQLCDFFRVWLPEVYDAAYDSYSECVRDGGSELPF